MKPDTTDPLIQKIERQNKIYHALQYLMIFLLLGGFLLIYVVTNNQNVSQASGDREIIRNIQNQNVQLKQAVDTLKKDNSDKLEQQERHLQCIARFFASTDRTARVIEDLDACLITNRGQPVSAAPIPLNGSHAGSLFVSNTPIVAQKEQSTDSDPPIDRTPTTSEPPHDPDTAAVLQPALLNVSVQTPLLNLHIGQ